MPLCCHRERERARHTFEFTFTQAHSHSFAWLVVFIPFAIPLRYFIDCQQMPIIFSFSVIIYQVNACTWHGYFRSTYLSPSLSLFPFPYLLPSRPSLPVIHLVYYCFSFSLSIFYYAPFEHVHKFPLFVSLSFDNFVGGIGAGRA